MTTTKRTLELITEIRLIAVCKVNELKEKGLNPHIDFIGRSYHIYTDKSVRL